MNEPTTTVRIWDLPTRLFHWVLAACVFGSIASAWIGGNAMTWHFRLGYVVFTLVAFRLVWGLVGGHWSRFANFVYGPSAVWRYLRGGSAGRGGQEVGHNPLGTYSVVAVVILLALQVGTGLFADDEIANTGPLQPFVANATSLALTQWHRNFGQWLIIGWIVLHLGAIVFYRVAQKRNLVGAMLTGDKRLAGPAVASADGAGRRLLALVVLALCAALVAWVVNLS